MWIWSTLSNELTNSLAVVVWNRIVDKQEQVCKQQQQYTIRQLHENMNTNWQELENILDSLENLQLLLLLPVV